MALQLYNTLSRSLEPFEPQEPGQARIYVCGMTTYDLCHIGHARAMMAFDVAVRYMRFAGYNVTYVRNYTDVDDKIIARAAELGEAPLELAKRFCDALDEDLASMGLIEPDHSPKVSEHIEGIVKMTASLVDKGHAYAAETGDVYFAVESFERYGKLSGKKLDDLRAGERVALDPNKRNPADFALWKSAKDGEISWESPWGAGRPGWHIECSVMSSHHLGESFDIHGGGIDLIFPHHENEIAQSECAHGTHPMAKYWLHNGHLSVVERDEAGDWQQIKMSKSLGNVVNIRDVVADMPAEALRWVYVRTHYRSPLPYSSEALHDAMGVLARLYEAKERAQEIANTAADSDPSKLAKESAKAGELYKLLAGFQAAFEEAMDQDLNTALASSLVLDVVRTINRVSTDKVTKRRGAGLMRNALQVFETSAKVLGIGGMEPAAFFAELREKQARVQGVDVSWVEAQLQARLDAREAKDWAAADVIRDALLEKRIMIMDSPSGVTWRIQV